MDGNSQAVRIPAEFLPSTDRLRISGTADPNDSLALSFITWAEVLQGAEGGQRRQATLRQIDRLVQLPMVC